jgi:UDP-N-acetylmuramoyl-L-alanyl-D-glutamate--2,6-diaminopimelate ligase
MRDMLSKGVKYLLMEVTSQSLKLERWPGVVFDYGVFTNLSLDHIGENEHKSYSEYVYCKSKLFKQCKHGIFNMDDKEYSTMINGFSGDIHTFGTLLEADLRLIDYDNVAEPGFRGIEITVAGMVNDKFRVSMLGYFNAYNIMCAISICNLLSVPIDGMKKVLEQVYVKGRMNQINISSKFDLFIDEAYQGIAMENVLKTIKETNPKRIVAVFGCGGNRSRQRRYDCGEVASKYADLSILTADNPRYEDNNDIIEDILVGMKKNKGEYIIIPDRRDAIKYSINNTKEGDVILILGRGAEEYQEINGIRSPFNDEKVVREIVNNLTDEERENLL